MLGEAVFSADPFVRSWADTVMGLKRQTARIEKPPSLVRRTPIDCLAHRPD